MTRTHSFTLAVLLVASVPAAFAQQPPRPADPSRAVTLSLAEYNRLVDLASRPAKHSDRASAA
jgi:hypothetical protein